MKNSIYLIALTLLFIFGCQNEITAPTAQGGKNTVSQNEPTLSVTFNHSPATINEPVTVTGSVAEDISGTTAKVQLFQAFDSDPAHNSNAMPVSCDYSGTITWVRVAQSDNGVGSVSYSWTPTATGHYGFRVHYVKGNSENDNLIGDCTDLEVNETNSCRPTVTTSVGWYGEPWVYWQIYGCDEEITNVRLAGHFSYGIYQYEYSIDLGTIPAGGYSEAEYSFAVVPEDGEKIGDGFYLEYDTPSKANQRIELGPIYNDIPG